MTWLQRHAVNSPKRILYSESPDGLVNIHMVPQNNNSVNNVGIHSVPRNTMLCDYINVIESYICGDKLRIITAGLINL